MYPQICFGNSFFVIVFWRKIFQSIFYSNRVKVISTAIKCKFYWIRFKRDDSLVFSTNFSMPLLNVPHVESTPWEKFLRDNWNNSQIRAKRNKKRITHALCHEACDDVFDVLASTTSWMCKGEFCPTSSVVIKARKWNWEFSRKAFIMRVKTIDERSLSENLECVLLIFAYRLTFFFFFPPLQYYFSFNSSFYCLLAFLSPQAVCARVVSPRLVLFGCKN